MPHYLYIKAGEVINLPCYRQIISIVPRNRQGTASSIAGTPTAPQRYEYYINKIASQTLI